MLSLLSFNAEWTEPKFALGCHANFILTLAEKSAAAPV
jgi:hypothetical protein